MTASTEQVGHVARLPRRLPPDLLRAVLVGALVSVLLAALGGRVVGALGVGFCCALASAALTRPFPVYQVLVFMCLVASAGEGELPVWTQESGFHLFSNVWKLLAEPGAREFGFLVIDGFEIVMAGLFAAVGIRMIRTRERPVALTDLWPIAAFGIAVVGMLGYGLATGGELKPALWQVRPFLHVVALAALTPQLLTTRSRVRDTMWTVAIGACAKAVEVPWLFVFHQGARFGEWRELVNHEASILFVSVIAFAVALFLYRTGGRQRTFLLCALPVLLLGLVLNLRRTGYVALAMSLAAVPLLLHGRRRLAIKLAIPVVALFAVYAAFFWTRTDDSLGRPIAKVKSLVMAEPGTTDLTSNLYRLGENYNLRRTIADYPLGRGFGHPFELYYDLPALTAGFVNWNYHPHNQLLGLWMALGPLGFATLLVFVASVMMLAAHEIRRQADPYAKAVCFFVIAGFASGVFATATDMFLWAERGATFTALLAGLLYALRVVEEREGPPRTAT